MITTISKVTLLAASLCLPILAWASLPAPVTEVLAKHKISMGSVSALVTEVDHNSAPLLSINPDTPRNPASVMKLVTTLVALETLGPAYTWHTRYFLDGTLDKTGTLNGDLIIKGGGDPYLVLEQFWRHLLSLREKGLRNIRGDLGIDNSIFSLPPHDRARFDKQPYRLYNVGPSATLINFNATRFALLPRNGAVNIVADPPMPNLRIVDKLKGQPGSCRGKQSGWSHRINNKRFRLGNPPGEGAEVTFQGVYRAACGDFDLRRAVLPTDDYTWGVFKSTWERLGGTLDGGKKPVIIGEHATPFVVGGSKPLSDVISGTNKYSNNIMARQLLMTIGLEASGEPATREKGVSAVHDWAQKTGLKMPELIIDNGAGLSRDIRISARSLIKLLDRGWASNYQPEFLSSLSLTAIDGTTRKRLRGLNPDGRIRLKTGLLNGTRSVAGYVKGDSGKQYAVALLINDPKIQFWSGNQVQDALLKWVMAQ